MQLKIWRSGKNGTGGRYETYQVEPSPGMTVLEALFVIQDTQDDSLAFRYSCRGAICGSCAMMINRDIRLACRTQLAGIERIKPMGLRPFPPLQKQADWAKGKEVMIEPLPNLPALKDLIVDMARFFDAYRKIKPWIDAADRDSGLSKMSPDECGRLEKYANCILCAACFGSCPVCDKDETYVGPAALAWSYRFATDPRDRGGDQRLATASEDDGVPSCEFVYNCVKACPKGIAPASAIRALKEMLGEDPGRFAAP